MDQRQAVMEYLEHMPAFLAGNGITRFSAFELCPVGKRNKRGDALREPPCELWANIIEVAQLVQEAREHFGAAINVNSGYRDPVYNVGVGSTSDRHTRFGSMDIWSAAVKPRELHAWFAAHPKAKRMGLGLYPTFVHVDLLRYGRW
jgi:uncharacterized protein YcbK (DUF882 family)